MTTTKSVKKEMEKQTWMVGSFGFVSPFVVFSLKMKFIALPLHRVESRRKVATSF